MSPTKRAELLYAEAEEQGLSAPTEAHISEAITHSESDLIQDIYMMLKSKGFGKAAELVISTNKQKRREL